MTTTPQNTVTIDGDTYETVTTHDLQIGDLICVHGAILKLTTREERPDTINKNDAGNVVWLRGYPIGYTLGAIPKSWLTRDEDGRAYWLVQGNGRATWLRMTNPRGRAPEGDTGYQIFDSMDRACSQITDCATRLHDDLQQLNAEAEETGSRLTYAIGRIMPDGSITFEC